KTVTSLANEIYRYAATGRGSAFSFQLRFFRVIIFLRIRTKDCPLCSAGITTLPGCVSSDPTTLAAVAHPTFRRLAASKNQQDRLETVEPARSCAATSCGGPVSEAR